MIKRVSLAVAIALCAATPVSAATLLFDFEGVDAQFDASFTLDSEALPKKTKDGIVTFNSVDVTIPKGTLNRTVNFYTSQLGGGFDFNQTHKFDANGMQLFSGLVTKPAFSTGVYTMTGRTGATIGTLTVSQINSAVPEPATWAMLVLGFALAGCFLRADKKQPEHRVRVTTHGQTID